MAALRAMLQMRASASTQPSPASSHTSLPLTAHHHHQHHYTFNNSSCSNSNNSNNNSTEQPLHYNHPLNQNYALPSTSSSTAASKPSTPAKKPYQNLGLHAGSASGNLGLVKFALDNGQPIDSILNGVSPIHAACCSNSNVAVVVYLIERGADVNSRRLPRKYSPEKGVQTVGTTGSTPLHFAAANGCLVITEILLRHGAIVDLTDKYGSSPLSVAIARNHPEVASLLHLHSSMQRGIMDVSPPEKVMDPFSVPRSSADSNRHSPCSSLSSSTAPSTRSGHSKDTSSQSLPLPSTRSLQTTRTAGQRRTSLPSITESPCAPSLLMPPRQSCDFDRKPSSTEPLLKRADPIRPSSTSCLVRTNSAASTLAPKPDSGASRPSSRSSSSLAHTRPESHRPMQRTQSAQEPQKNRLKTPDAKVASMKRRRSMESARLLSPNSALTVHRRRSFDQLSDALTLADAKTRRTSDASTASNNTATSSTYGIGLSGNSSDTTLDNNGTVLEDQESTPLTSTTDAGQSHLATTALMRSWSQPGMEKPHSRTLRIVASEASTRQSLDLQRLVSSQERSEPDLGFHASDSDLPGKLSRRRTMLETPNPRLVRLPRHHSLGPTVMDETHSGPCLSDQAEADPRPSVHHSHFSGSATVSGRFSRIWSHASGKENIRDGSGGNWNVGEFAESSSEAATQHLVKSDTTRSRSGVLNRLSGIWARR